MATEGMPELVTSWRSRGEMVDIGGYEHFVVDTGPDDPDAPVMVLLHGFPGSSFDWRGVVDDLAAQWRVLTFDYLGFGFSAKPDMAYSLFDQTDRAEELFAARAITTATLVAHDLGDTVAAELLARSNEGRSTVRWAGCVLTNGSIFIDMAQLTPGQLGLLALPDEALAESLGADELRAGLAATFPPDRPEPEVLDAIVWLVHHRSGDLLLPRTIRYIEERREHQPRWTAGLRDFAGPLVAAWGDLDPIAVKAMADHLGQIRQEQGNPVEVVHWPDLGHWPSVEAPDIVAGLLADQAAAFLT